jgi:hypothetical protein
MIISNSLRSPVGRFNMVSLANHTNCTLNTVRLVNDRVAECSSHFLKCLLLSLREVEVSNRQEECRAYYEDVVIVLVDVGESTGPSLSD